SLVHIRTLANQKIPEVRAGQLLAVARILAGRVPDLAPRRSFQGKKVCAIKPVDVGLAPRPKDQSVQTPGPQEMPKSDGLKIPGLSGKRSFRGTGQAARSRSVPRTNHFDKALRLRRRHLCGIRWNRPGLGRVAPKR